MVLKNFKREPFQSVVSESMASIIGIMRLRAARARETRQVHRAMTPFTKLIQAVVGQNTVPLVLDCVETTAGLLAGFTS